MNRLLSELKLNTVCQEAKCPNISECFSRGEATFMILGKICTRNCSFCGVEKGIPEPIDKNEPKNVAEAIKRLNLKHAVITSVTRDDLPLGGASHFAETIDHIKRSNPNVTIEVLIPDFKMNQEAINIVIKSRPDIIAHNVETVPSLYRDVRLASYKRSLNVLKEIKNIDSNIYTKSGLMLGLGEKEEEVINVFSDLADAECDFLSIGQYLSPSKHHYPVKKFVEPSKFDYYKKQAQDTGLKYVLSAPYVRSSYKAGEYLERIKDEGKRIK